MDDQKTGNPVNCAKQLRRLAKITRNVFTAPSEMVLEGGSLVMREREVLEGGLRGLNVWRRVQVYRRSKKEAMKRRGKCLEEKSRT